MRKLTYGYDMTTRGVFWRQQDSYRDTVSPLRSFYGNEET